MSILPLRTSSDTLPSQFVLTWPPLTTRPYSFAFAPTSATVGDGGYSPSGSTLPGVLPCMPTPHWFVRLLRRLGFNARFYLDRDVKQQMGGRRYTVLRDRFLLHSWVV